MTERSVLITGCSSGIGHDAAHTLAKRGWRVFATCRKDADCARLRDEGLESFRLDYADPDSIAAAVDEALARTGGTLDAVYNNGAFGMPAAVEDLPRAALAEMFEANVFGPHDLTRRVIPAMRAQGHGRIVNCSSVFGYAHFPWRGAYISTKHGLEGLTDVLRAEMRGTGIEVSLIQPGLITTKFGDNSMIPFERWIDWEASVRAEGYRDLIAGRRGGRSRNARLEAPASAVTAKLIHALESPRPRARYKVTRLAHVAAFLDWILPARAADALVVRL